MKKTNIRMMTGLLTAALMLSACTAAQSATDPPLTTSGQTETTAFKPAETTPPETTPPETTTQAPTPEETTAPPETDYPYHPTTTLTFT